MSSIFTVISLVTFLGILFWAYSAGNKERFDEIARMPIDHDNATTGN